MARVTVEDCIEKIPSRFELVMMASQRVRKITSGAALTIERDMDKNPVIALREIAGETVNIADLKEELIRNKQRMVAFEEEEEEIDLMDGEEEWETIAAQQQQAEGIYSEEEIKNDAVAGESAGEPSLGDLAGGDPET